MNDPTQHDLKIQDAQDCIREYLRQHEEGHYASRADALAAAQKTLSPSGLDTSQMIEAFEPWAKEMA
jgi:hypothetical protein